MTIVLYIIIGLLSGALTGLGIGGGTLLIPALIFILNMGQREAQSINLIYFIPSAVIAVFTHAKNGDIEKKIMRRLIVSGLLSAAAGAVIASRLDGDWLKIMFGVFLLVMGCAEFFKKENKNENEKP
ncbi:MAG: sulfite exporter TauE/SafE family protein [Clostridiales bacterium]|jgi:uncharacterized membrane protein YfcA|nr:sulfite exporter TauE/SafE family protein [Clostridiales bacterium]